MVDMLIYTNGGDTYNHTRDMTPTKLKEFGRSRNQTWMYKGYRYYNNKKEIVVVFDKKEWSLGEMAKRKANGFMGIRESRV